MWRTIWVTSLLIFLTTTIEAAHADTIITFGVEANDCCGDVHFGTNDTLSGELSFDTTTGYALANIETTIDQSFCFALFECNATITGSYSFVGLGSEFPNGSAPYNLVFNFAGGKLSIGIGSSNLYNGIGPLAADFIIPTSCDQDIPNNVQTETSCGATVFGQADVLSISEGVITNPLPASLPLMATGLGALGLFGWRRKRKNADAIAAARQPNY